MAPLVFISHSAKQDEAACAVLDALYEDLTGAGFDVFLDRERLQGGFDWRDEIMRSLVRCHAAAVVVSETAFESDWVPAEAQVLKARKYVNPRLPIIPILVGVTPERLASSPLLDPTRLEDLQAIPGEDAPGAAARVTALLAPLLVRHAPDSPLVKAEQKVADMLRGRDAELLQAVGTALALKPEDWALEAQPRRLLAERLLATPIESLWDALSELRSVDPELAANVFEVVAPFAWVDMEAALAIDQVSRQDPPRGVGVSSSRTLTCKMYVRCGAPLHRVSELPSAFSEEMAAELLDEVRGKLAEEFKFSPLEPPSDATLRKLIRKQNVVIVFEHPPPDDGALVDVKREFPELTLFFAAGPRGAEALTECGLDFAVLLQPDLDPERERSALEEYEVVQQLLR